MSIRSSRALSFFAVLALTASLRADVDQTFRLDTSDWKIQPKNVHLAGDFNGWNIDAAALKPGAKHVWSTIVKLEEGQHAYKFVVDAGTKDQRWITDPKADVSLETDDGNQGKNSGVIAGVDVAKLPPPKPNAINMNGVRFDPKDDLDWDGDFVRIRVRAQADDVQSVQPIITVGETNGYRVEAMGGLKKVGAERGFDIFAGLLPMKGASGSVALQLRDQDALMNLALKREVRDMSKMPDATVDAGFAIRPESHIPAWTADAVWYQIFVDRFRNADPANDPGDFSAYERLIAWNAEWHKTQPGEVPGDENFFHGAGNVWNRRYGGDLKGVQEKLPYLRSLGINALYLNPIFEAESMHKYDTADYRHVDDNFGVRDGSSLEGGSPLPPSTGGAEFSAAAKANGGRGLPPSTMESLGNHELFNLNGTPVSKDFRETDDPKSWKWTQSDLVFLSLLKDAHAQGFHVIIDGVFNHVGRAHVFFQDVLAKGKNSPYADWFEITDFGDEKNWKPMADPFTVHGKPGGIQWNAWDGKNGFLPNFKKDAKLGIAHGPREHILAIAQRWGDPDGDPKTHDGIDGWRLDAAEQVPHPFWVDFRTAVKKTDPDAYIDGEIWNPAQPWVNDGKEFDAVMNYQFAMAAQSFFVNEKHTKPSEFNNRLAQLWLMYPHATALAMQNLYDSHDTDRVASMIVNPDRPYDGANRPQDNAKDKPYDESKPTPEQWARVLQMVAFQNTFIGAPMTYYGDEAGMWGADDPSNRQPLPWDDRGPYASGVGFDHKLFDGYQRFAAIRNHFTPLREGGFYPATIDDTKDVYAFARSFNNEYVYVALNRASEARTVKLEVLENVDYIDYANSTQAKVEMDNRGPTARPTIAALPDAKPVTATGGTLSVTLPPHGVAILAKR